MYHSRGVWALLLVLDVLPWPWGEHMLAALTMATGLLRPGRRNPALAWARAHGTTHPWRLAAAFCASGGRYVARTYVLGSRRPEDWRKNLVLEGADHLTALTGGAILLGFHVGPPRADVALSLLGHPVTLLGWSDHAGRMAWWRDAWRPFMEPSPFAFAAGDRSRWPAVLYGARRALVDGARIFVHADGEGKEAFGLPVLGGEWHIRAGWLALHEVSGVPVLPVFRRLDGYREVTTIHAPLPGLGPDRQAGLGAWRDHLTRLADDYLRRFPEQCPDLVLRHRWTRPGVTAASASDPRTARSTHSSGSG